MVAPRPSQFPQKQIVTKNGRIITWDIVLDQRAINPPPRTTRPTVEVVNDGPDGSAIG